MSKIQWEYDLVERPFCEQLKAMGLHRSHTRTLHRNLRKALPSP